MTKAKRLLEKAAEEAIGDYSVSNTREFGTMYRSEITKLIKQNRLGDYMGYALDSLKGGKPSFVLVGTVGMLWTEVNSKGGLDGVRVVAINK